MINEETNNNQDMDQLQERIHQLEAQSVRNESILEQALDGVVTINGRTKEITFFNKAAERMWGYSREEVLGKNIKTIVPPEHQASHDGYVDHNVNGGADKIVGSSRDVEIERKDGSRFWANLALSKIIVGEEIMYTAFVKDITEMKLERAKTEQLLEQAIDGVVTIDGKTKDIIFFNASAERMWGYKREEVLGKNIKHIVPNAIQREHDGYVDHNVNGGADKIVGSSRDVEIERKDGSIFWANLALTRINVGDKVLYTAFVKDIHSVKAPIMELKEIIIGMAQGDLTVKPTLESHDYVGEMSDALGVTIDSLSEILGNIENIATTVATSSEEMLSAGREMKSTTGEVASAIAQMSEGAAQTAQRTDESSRLIGDVSGVAKGMAGKAESINNAAEKGQESCVSGLETIKKVVNNMIEIQTSASSTSASIDILTERSEEIARTLNVITEIAAQTNLLALNAAIEAARAGDAGRGFAVVAEEIRNLAENSRNSAVDIEKVIKEVQKDIAGATKQIDLMSGSVKSGNEASLAAEKVFENIEETSSMTLGLAKEIVSASESQMTSINSVVKNIESIVVVSEETATGAEEIASSSTELDSAMNEVTSNSQNLADLAVELQTGVDRFKLD